MPISNIVIVILAISWSVFLYLVYGFDFLGLRSRFESGFQKKQKKYQKKEKK
jgi:hypothetical protein